MNQAVYEHICKITEQGQDAAFAVRKRITLWHNRGRAAYTPRRSCPADDILTNCKNANREDFIKIFFKWLEQTKSIEIPPEYRRKAPNGVQWFDFGGEHQYTFNLIKKLIAGDKEKILKDLPRWSIILFHDRRVVDEAILSDDNPRTTAGCCLAWNSANIIF